MRGEVKGVIGYAKGAKESVKEKGRDFCQGRERVYIMWR